MSDLPPDCPHSLLTDLLAAQDSAAGFGCGLWLRALAAGFGCGLEPRLLEMLQERHAARDGAQARGRAGRACPGPQIATRAMRRVASG
jgi:hypothetical protein